MASTYVYGEHLSNDNRSVYFPVIVRHRVGALRETKWTKCSNWISNGMEGRGKSCSLPIVDYTLMDTNSSGIPGNCMGVRFFFETFFYRKIVDEQYRIYTL